MMNESKKTDSPVMSREEMAKMPKPPMMPTQKDINDACAEHLKQQPNKR